MRLKSQKKRGDEIFIISVGDGFERYISLTDAYGNLQGERIPPGAIGTGVIGKRNAEG